MFFSRWHYSTVFGFSYLSCLWLHLRSVTFQPPPPLPEVSLGGALVVSVCASEVTGILLLPGSLLTPVSLLGTVRWTLLYPSSPWLWALLPQWGDGDNGGGVGSGSKVSPLLLELSGLWAPPPWAGARVTGVPKLEGPGSQALLLLLPSSLWAQVTES